MKPKSNKSTIIRIAIFSVLAIVPLAIYQLITSRLLSISYDILFSPSIYYTPEPVHINDCLSVHSQNLSSTKNIIYDFFLFNDELDMLEIRLYELYDYVTLFLIAESNLTLSGKAKPLHLKENWNRFRGYHSKMRRVELTLTNLSNNATESEAWNNEERMRNQGIQLLLPKSTEEFFLMTSDVDEIPKSRIVRALQLCPLPKQFTPLLLQCDFYYYSFEFLQPRSPFWPGTTVSRFRRYSMVPRNIRNARGRYRSVAGGCFHCSYCFDSVTSVRSKLNSFSHTELNIDQFRSVEHIVDHFRNGRDLFDRVVKPFERSKKNETELPRLLRKKEGRRRFAYLLERSSMPNAGFRDV